MNSVQLDIQEKHNTIMRERQIQLSELKLFFNKQNSKRYKDIILLDLEIFDELYSKVELRSKCENLISLIVSIGKVLEMNSSFKTILLSLKIFEEHNKFIQTKPQVKGFVYRLFEYNSSVPYTKNEIIKSTQHVTPKKEFFSLLFKDSDSNKVSDFNSFLNFQTDKKQKPADAKEKINSFSDQLSKLFQGSTVNYFTLYTRIYSSFDFDISEVATIGCDVMIMLYNKLSDKNCCQTDIVEYVSLLDDYIYDIFIKPLSDDLQHLAELIMKKEFDLLNKELDKHFQ